MKILLYPFGLIYLLITSLNRGMYERGFFKRKRLPRPVISIGNLTMGGSGKTPLTKFLAKKLIEKGMIPAIILRGYGRKTKGPILVTKNSTAEEVGEEALLYKRELELDIVVAERREEALSVLPSLPDIFLLDDGFQHFRVFRDRDILVVDASRPEDLRPLPFGFLREPLGSAKSASLVVVTKGSKEGLPGNLKKIMTGKPVIEAVFEWKEKLYPDGILLEQAAGKKMFLLLGIGNPANFRKMAVERGLNIIGEKILPDHAFPTPKLIAGINEAAAGADYILTSEKDFVKWSKAEGFRTALAYPKLRLTLRDPESHLEKLLSGL
jgi:tetraacyldisaccharide 4'-kinase